MNPVGVLLLLSAASAIRVPTVWPQSSKTTPYVNQQQQPLTNRRHPNLKTLPNNNNYNDWTPIVPNYNNNVPKANTNRYNINKPVKKKIVNLRQKPRSEIFNRRVWTNQPDVYRVDEQIPTRPIYPGEGQWAVRGFQHRPFIAPPTVTSQVREEPPPEGIEVFEKNAKLFDKLKEKHQNDEENNAEVEEENRESGEDEEEEKEEDEGFVPMQLYTQVRRTEDEEHLPRLHGEDERLREIVKDSKIQTVYTEEGYEDAAYDHAGHEKHAEEDEGFAEFDKDVDRQKLPESKDDSDSAGTEYVKDSKPKKQKMKKDNFIKTEETKTTAVKDTGGGNAEMEISSQIKILAAPNNSSKTHKYVKIFPKIYRYDRIEPQSITEAPIETNKEDEKEPSFDENEFGFEKTVEVQPEVEEKSEAPVEKNESKIEKGFGGFINQKVAENVTKTVEALNHLKEKYGKNNKRGRKIKNGLHRVKFGEKHSETSTQNNVENNSNLSKPKTFKKHQIVEKNHKNNNNVAPTEASVNFVENFKKTTDLTNQFEDDLKFLSETSKATTEAQFETTTASIVAHIPELQFDEEPEDDVDFSETTPTQNVEESKNLVNVEIAKIEEITTPVPTIDTPTSTSSSSSQLEAIESISRSFLKIDRKRFKRSEPSISDENTDFVDETLLKQTDDKKYPYYFDLNINPDSPLRYSEDLSNIPDKIYDDMAFYNQADRIECPEVETHIDPIPDHVKNTEKSANEQKIEDNGEKLVNGPRLQRLGDKIECFKQKYFGKNPLDSPFFKEVTIAPVVPVLNFASTNKINKKHNDVVISTTIAAETQQSDEVKTSASSETPDDQTILNKENLKESNSSKILDKLDKTASSEAPIPNDQITIITTPKYTIDLKPKHIYDQIKLLHYLPPYPLNASISRESKSIEATTSESNQPESAPLRKRRRRIRPMRPHHPHFNNLAPVTPSSFPTSTPLSEVHYKTDIKPIEQLNVFADIINNIKNSTKEELLHASSQIPTNDRIAVKLNTFGNGHQSTRVNHVKNSVAALEHIEKINNFYLSTTKRPVGWGGSTTHLINNNPDDGLDEQKQFDGLELLKIGAETSTVSSDVASVSEANNDEEPEVLGMMPPGLDHYKTIYAPEIIKKPFIVANTNKKMNNFYYIGMKPPSVKQKILLYSDFKLNNAKRKFLARRRISKRSAQRPMYSAVVRNRNKPIDVDEDEAPAIVVADEDDDYVPHRPKNYHYDEKTGRIVYDKPQTTEAPDDEAIEYIEITEAPLPKPTRRNQQLTTSPQFVEVTGPSYVEYIKLLKNNPKYEAIPDPTTTEKSDEAPIITTTTTAKPVSTTPPEFIGILAKVRSNSNYKSIEDKKSTTTTTTEAPTEAEVEETQLENVQNSPGGQSSNAQNFQIFDITEYLPKVKNYSPRTSIDYSKYKTIERPNVNLRHNLSSRYNSEEEELKDVRTSRIPILHAEKTEEIKEETTSHSPIIVAETTSEAPTSTSTQKIRVRTRGRITRRPTTRTTTIPSDAQSASTSASMRIESVTHDKPKRTYPHRRPTRIRISSKIPDNSEAPKTVRRRQASPTKDMENRMDKINDTRVINPRRIGQVEVFQKFDKMKRHGGGYRKQNGAESESKHVTRLADVVPKPDKFYTDKKLPENINKLKEVEVESGEVVSEEEETEDNGKDEGEGGEVHDEVLDYDAEAEEELDERPATTKKPIIVKDPGKRLYYYAPV